MQISIAFSNLKLLFCLLCCLIISSIAVWADDLRLRDGTVIKADAVWERDNLIWYQQGQIIRSIPVSEVLRGADLAKATEPVQVEPNKSALKKSARHQKFLPPNVAVSAVPVALPTPNAKPITRIVFKDGVQLDADAIWEMGDKIAYRLGNVQAFVEKDVVAQVLKDYAPSTPEPVKAVERTFSFTTRNAGLDQLISANAARHEIDPLLIYLVMQQESGFNHRAVSRAGARGLMQLMPDTARQLGVRNIHDPVENVEAGTRYLKNLLQRFSGDVNLALAAYNAGEEAVVRYGNRVPPYRETINYVRRISWAYHQYKK